MTALTLTAVRCDSLREASPVDHTPCKLSGPAVHYSITEVGISPVWSFIRIVCHAWSLLINLFRPIYIAACVRIRARPNAVNIYELDPYFLEMYRMSENELPTSRLSKVIV